MRIRTCSLLVVLLFVTVNTTAAVTYEWNNPAGGLFQDGANWSGGVAPSTWGDLARFNISGSYTVDFNGDVGITQVGIGPSGNSIIHFDLSGYELLIGETSQDAIEVGRDTGCSGTVEFSNGVLAAPDGGVQITNNSFMVLRDGAGLSADRLAAPLSAARGNQLKLRGIYVGSFVIPLRMSGLRVRPSYPCFHERRPEHEACKNI